MMNETVRRNTVGTAKMSTGLTHEAKLFYTWLPTNPMVLDMLIEIALGSREVLDEEFPEGLSCLKCHVPLSEGNYYIPVAISSEVDELWCLSCGYRKPGSDVSQERWEISADLVARAVDGRTDLESPVGQVKVWRVSDTEIRFTLSQGGNVMKLSVQAEPLLSMFREIRQIARTRPGGRIDDSYLSSGIAELEALANGTL